MPWGRVIHTAVWAAVLVAWMFFWQWAVGASWEGMAISSAIMWAWADSRP